MRVYFDNMFITYMWRYLQGKDLNPTSSSELEALISLSKRKDVEFLLSEESLAEIRQLPEDAKKRKPLEDLYFGLKQGKTVIRNSSVAYNDCVTYNSPDVRYNHPYNDRDLSAVKAFLRSKGNAKESDARYIANAMLPENKIDVFLTGDKKSIWAYREEIKKRFKVLVKLPTELERELQTEPY